MTHEVRRAANTPRRASGGKHEIYSAQIALLPCLCFLPFRRLPPTRRIAPQLLPSHGPQPVTATPHPVEPNRNYSDKAGHPNVPHVDGKTWVGHDTGRDHPRYHIDQPFAHGRFTGGFGRGHVWHLGGGGPSRFWFNGWYWDVAAAELLSATAGYGIRRHRNLRGSGSLGWYLAYNVRLGTYVHVEYLGM